MKANSLWSQLEVLVMYAFLNPVRISSYPSCLKALNLIAMRSLAQKLGTSYVALSAHWFRFLVILPMPGMPSVATMRALAASALIRFVGQ